MKRLLLYFTLFLGVMALFGAGALYYAFSLLQPLNSAQTEKKTFVVAKGQSVSSIGQKLKEKDFIQHPLAFRFVVWQEGLQSKIQAGSFLISPSMSTSEIAQELTKGTNDTWITVLEGWRVEEIADMLEDLELPEFDREEFIELAKADEGYLFPDTYLIPKSATTESIYNLLRDNFEKKIEKGLASEIEASGKSLKDVVIMASIVEREGRGLKQMQSIAGVLWKRMEIGMALNADATLQYISGYNSTQKNWWSPPNVAVKESTSLYNTYKYSGLPPAPIANPGLDAIKATLQPEKHEYLYYLHDRQGKIHMAKDLNAHNQNVQEYLR